VELVATEDDALDWSGRQRPEVAVIPLRDAPLRGSSAPDVFTCRALTMTELVGIGHSGRKGQEHISTTAILFTGLESVRPSGQSAITDRLEIWQLIEAHRIPAHVYLGLARWIWEASRGDSAGRRFRDGAATHGAIVDR
jgi:hypothetical protein